MERICAYKIKGAGMLRLRLSLLFQWPRSLPASRVSRSCYPNEGLEPVVEGRSFEVGWPMSVENWPFSELAWPNFFEAPLREAGQGGNFIESHQPPIEEAKGIGRWTPCPLANR
ncbi:unnamed protein product, partial [Protopolystoma xenopodis]